MATRTINKVLIANRGEIALRVQRACDHAGKSSCIVAAPPDAEAYFARRAHELALLEEVRGYLNPELLVKTALDRGCDAVHPGYGFLSENAHFARTVENAGLIWIGPSPEAIRTMGDKTAARAAVTAYGVPVTPGSAGSLDDDALETAAEKIGYPVLIKAQGGGGGRGMRVVEDPKELRDLLTRARAEALKNFGSGDVYLEKYIVNPRHVEVQVFGDSHGSVLHLGTRDCTVQRRHQKLIEEAPAPALSDAVRERLHDAACKAAKSVSYAGAGTVEFLVRGDEVYFLEMNTRIQVEHPVTEEVTGRDLVAWQLDVAEGKALPCTQSDIEFTGHAIEFRIYAEDPAKGFQPATGEIRGIERMEAPWLRDEFGFDAGDRISPYYDAMLSKLIVRGANRKEAIARAYSLLSRYRVKGLPTTVPFHRWMLRQPEFLECRHDIGMVDRTFTAASLEDLAASECRDPRHREPEHGAETIESVRVATSRGFRELRVLHEVGGTFLFLGADGVPLVRSNSMEDGIEAAVRTQ